MTPVELRQMEKRKQAAAVAKAGTNTSAFKSVTREVKHGNMMSGNVSSFFILIRYIFV